MVKAKGYVQRLPDLQLI